MSNSIFQNVLSRQIIQIRFRPTLTWFEARNEIAKKLEKKYVEWRIDENGNIALYSPDDQKALEVFTNQITSLSENNSMAADEGIDHLTTIMDPALSSCGLNEIRRIGFRQTKIFKSTLKFDEVVDLLDKKLFSQEKELKILQGVKLNDSAYIVDSKHGELNNHIQIGAVKKDQAISIFATKFKIKKEFEEDSNLFVDIDTFLTSNINSGNYQKILLEIMKLNQSLLEGYIKYLTNS